MSKSLCNEKHFISSLKEHVECLEKEIFFLRDEIKQKNKLITSLF